ncbi:MAG: Flp1 family type IVb pilin [Eubacteriales bacterium]|nr:Flp1 family type IVb pilin [Eubacteriales bacterium]MDD4324018.1 Flp1 family type IVb pilin [Eubacteriales bacterium]MDD4540620.1 Flp1 family type IVb pilin [Eubacteriales bacterium]
MKNLNSENRKNVFRRSTKSRISNLQKNVYCVPAVGSLEIVIIIAVLLSIALIFRTQITSFANSLFTKVFDQSYITNLP